MKVNIPSQSRRILQDNKNPFNGNIAESFNLDLTSTRGKIGVTRTKKVADVVAPQAQTFQVGAINQANGNLIYVGGGSALDLVYEGGPTAFSSTFVRDSSSVGYAPSRSDVHINNATMYVTESSSFSYSQISSFGSWTEVSSPALDSSSPHLLTSLDDKTYVTNLDYKVGYISSANVLTLTGDNTLDLGMSGYTITVFMASLSRVWIGLSSLQTGRFGTTYVYEWDGASNLPNQRYEIDASGLICGVIKDGTPYVLDTNGRLLRYSGASFTEVARLPYKNGELMEGFNTNQFNQRAIHPRAITVDQDEILINVSNRIQSDSTDSNWADFPSGVWAWSEENGLYHKYSASYQAVADTGTTNLTDWGQMRVAQAGAIFVHDAIENISQAGEGGRVIFSQRYFNSADSDTEVADVDVTYLTAIFADDTKQNTQKWGYFITPEIHTNDITESWQNIYAKFKPFLDSSDKVVVKYKTEKKDKITADFTFSDINIVTSTADLSDVTQGDEIQIIQGYGSGKSFHIRSITENAGTYTIIPDETFDSLVIGQTFVGEVDNWIKAGEIQYATPMKQWKEFTINKDTNSPVAQFKVCMQFTGNDELYGITINSNKNI